MPQSNVDRDIDWSLSPRLTKEMTSFRADAGRMKSGFDS